MCEREGDGAAERFTAHKGRRWIVFEDPQGAFGQAVHTVSSQVEMVVERERLPDREQRWRVAQQQARMPIQARDDQHPRPCGAGVRNWEDGRRVY